MRNVILASGSPRRKELLEQIQIRPVVIPSSVQEKITKTEASEVVMELSEQKCLDVAEGILEGRIDSPELSEDDKNSQVVLGADTVVVLDGKILGKPHSEEEACKMLRDLQGREHQVCTGVTLIWLENGLLCRKETFYVSTEVSVAAMSESEILSYVATGEPMDKAGAYGIQGIFARHVEKIEGDYNNVVGLPVAEVYRHLRK